MAWFKLVIKFTERKTCESGGCNAAVVTSAAQHTHKPTKAMFGSSEMYFSLMPTDLLSAAEPLSVRLIIHLFLMSINYVCVFLCCGVRSEALA